ncbi:hypothetical protein [Streptomyces mexicanus]|uniref:hypothetical protein n=1 Tax=Streptomyces mexicanus TaxID=178566 RepID=UPI0031EAD632
MPHEEHGGPVAGRRSTRFLTTGCLTALVVLIVVLTAGLSWLWYADRHAGTVNGERRQRAVSSVLRQARADAEATARSLDASGDGDVDRLTGVIARHTASPLITYDTSRHTFTALLARQAVYERLGVVPGGGSDMVSRCLEVTYSRPDGRGWTPKVTVRDDDVCRPATEIGHMARLAGTRIAGLAGHELTRGAVQKALDPTGALRTYSVTSVTRTKDTAVVLVRISSRDRTAGQCYRVTRPVTGPAADRPSVTAAAASSC